MATFQVRGGKHRVQIRRPDFKASETFTRLIDAQAWARKIEREYDVRKIKSVPADALLSDIITRYEKELWPIKKWSHSKADHLSALKRDLGTRHLTKLTKHALVEYGRSLTETLGGPSIGTRLSYLHTVLAAARDLWDMTVPTDEVNAALSVLRHHDIVWPGTERTREPKDFEIDLLMGYAARQTKATVDLGAIIRILNVLPLRVGELLNIEWTDLNHEERAVMIRGRKHPNRRIKETNDDKVSLIKVGDFDTFELIAGRPEYYSRPFPYDRPTVSSAFYMAAKTCEIVDLHLHDLRAGAVSRLFAMGVSIPVTATMSGHKDWKVLQKHYERISAEQVHAAVAKASGI